MRVAGGKILVFDGISREVMVAFHYHSLVAFGNDLVVPDGFH
jgi:hypothetical protein